MKRLGDDDGEPDTIFDRMGRTHKALLTALGIIVALTVYSHVFGGPCTAPDDDPYHAQCSEGVYDPARDAVVGNTHRWWVDWTQGLQTPVSVSAGYFWPGLGVAAVAGHFLHLGYQKYLSPQVVLNGRHHAIDPLRDVIPLANGVTTLLRLGRPANTFGAKADEGIVEVLTGAMRKTGRGDIVVPQNAPRVHVKKLSPTAYSCVAKEGLKGPYFRGVDVQDIQEVDPKEAAEAIKLLNSDAVANDTSDKLDLLIHTGDEVRDFDFRDKWRKNRAQQAPPPVVVQQHSNGHDR